MKKENVFRKWILTLFLTILAVMMLFPIVFTLTNSFMTEHEIGYNYDSIGEMKKDTPFINLKLIPDLVSFEQYGTVLVKNPTFLKMFWNSVFMVVPIIVGQVIVASFAAYVFAKVQFRGRDKLFIVYLLTMLMPFQVTLVPNYIITDKLGILNSMASIILPGIFGAFGVFMLRQFMLHIPDAYIEAAKMDGAGHITIFFKIILPLVRPGIAALIVLLFADYWNMIEQPLIFLNDESKHPLSLYLSKINEGARGVGFSASILYMTPMVLLFLYAQSYFIKGIQLSGVKE
ncbi:carbohydrate ABC transporter permease [Bacillus pseudomycoides]|uniref:carbohydrate ABC transporter permease n=1 Tax=Bacillus pseudomycoides TaxID=64104 RepID=UPI000BEB9597|nr:carbohydrate ABC transporter permease [Bacillus pseudomycoides]PEA84405.1 sugar ABC transporter permease [Bacillus pseudomycoides]PED74004.1 sugar ABC transporter permease [Bacillus pseudomycoides]PEI42884.1 sugar ABC transporter permease [Bacillus pseudomycoides]PEJ80401.1 sugar ABC transporter permease [Bacillus pseudomycoides]PEM22636.1 sugar ABC transporter permease [Bacillus pseudomycoides]